MKKSLKKLHVALLILLFSTIALNFIPTSMGQATTAIISVSPSSIVLGEEGQPLPKSFSLSVNVTDVTDLYSWQIRLYYSSRVLNLTTATAPTGHVFEGKDSVEIPQEIVTWRKTINNSTAINFTNIIGSTWVTQVESPGNPSVPRNYNIVNWVDKDTSDGLTVGDIIFINPNLPSFNEFYYVDAITFEGSIIHLDISVSSLYWGAALLPPAESFNGNGTLCQVNFDAIRPGVRAFNFSHIDTYLLNSTHPDLEMPLELGSGSITVHGIPVQKDPSSITIDMKSTAEVGSSVRISGAISPLKVGATVKIEYRPAGGTFTTLTETQTEEASSYSFQWNPAETGTYEFKASWTGDEEYQGAESETKTITVTTGEGGPSTPLSEYLIYIVIIVVIIIIVVGVYFLRIKKKS